MNAGFIWLAVTTGFLSVLTPCVFPMIPITVAFFSSRVESRQQALKNAGLFALGIVLTFSVLGLVLASVFGATGLNRFAADPTVNLILAAFFVVFAANLFGWVQLALPWKVLTAAERASAASSRSSIGALLMGATFTLTSVTCTAPFVGTLLVLAARGTWSTPVLGMLIYSSAFALPFFFLAVAPRYLSKLPGSGSWMATLRVIMGLLEIAAAIKFASNADMVLAWGVLSRDVVLLAWAILSGVAAIYLLRPVWIRPTIRRQDVAPLGVALGATALAVWLATGVNGKPRAAVEAFLPSQPAVLSESSAPSGAEWILNNYDGALATARASNKLVFVDFTGYTCTNCRWMEANVFNRPDVSSELGEFVLSRLYTDGEGGIYERQQEFQERQFGTVALPLYAVVNADGTVRATFSGLTRNPAEFIAFLRKART
ncbi:MAG TPA: cytochrome c biogenesis protein CcdA [Gemmatimonadaceae bacterium]|nr:cytochrome c biogenesis protein CcdA [Gemmatimonadaceae bacterium]